MSATALMDWLGQNMPEEQRTARAFSCPTDFHAYMISLSGVFSLFSSHDERCAAYLKALQAKHPTVRKPAPQVPPPVWDTRPVSADRAIAAVRALSRGVGHG